MRLTFSPPLHVPCARPWAPPPLWREHDPPPPVSLASPPPSLACAVCQALAHGCCSSRSLAYLRLDRVGMQHGAAASLAQCLIPTTSALRKLDLSHNKLGDRGVMVSGGGALRKLDLSHNCRGALLPLLMPLLMPFHMPLLKRSIKLFQFFRKCSVPLLSWACFLCPKH